MRLARTSFRGFTASLKSLWITGSHANSAMLVLPCSSSCLQEPQDLRSELFLTISTVHAGHLPHSGPLMCSFSFCFVSSRASPHDTFRLRRPEQKSEHCSCPYFRPNREKGGNFFEFINLFLPFCLFHESAFLSFFFHASRRENTLFFCA